MENIYYNMTTYDEWSNSISITSTPILWGKNPDLSPFRDTDIEEVYGVHEISNEWDWGTLIYGKLKDGRFFFYATYSDMTFGNTEVIFGESREDLEQFALGDVERGYFGIK